MNSVISLILLPVVAALIGWVTNYIAVKMLFHPRKPLRFFWMEIQGVFPKRQAVVATKLGEVVASELLSAEDIKNAVANPAAIAKLKELVERNIETVLMQKLPNAIPMLSMFLNKEIIGLVKSVFLEDIDKLLPQITTELGAHIDESIDIRKIVEDKVKNFSSDKLEEILFSIMKKEFRFIELVGGVLGFFIGVIQVLLVSGIPESAFQLLTEFLSGIK